MSEHSESDSAREECGADVEEDDDFCPSCGWGASVAMSAAATMLLNLRRGFVSFASNPIAKSVGSPKTRCSSAGDTEDMKSMNYLLVYMTRLKTEMLKSHSRF